MDIVFFGTDAFAQQILEFLLEKGLPIKGIVTRPDRPRGRGGRMSPCTVKEYLLKTQNSIPLFEPEKASDPDFIESIRNLKPKIFLVVSYGQILRQNLLDIPQYAINIHPSLLPRYRGPSPIQSAVLAGEKEVGVCIIEMVAAMDAGDILGKASCPLGPETTYGEIEQILCDMSKELVLQTLGDIHHGPVQRTPQEESEATFTKKIDTSHSFIDWSQSAQEVVNQIRGMNPRPCARCFVEIKNTKKLCKILRAQVNPQFSGKPGEQLFYDKEHGWIIACGTHSISILEVQLEGKRSMDISTFQNGILNIKFV